MSKTHTYPTRDYMLEEYTASDALPFINFEGHMYSFEGKHRKGDLKLHLYRSLEENEQHYILVHMRYNVPFLIKTFYSIERVSMPNIWRYVGNYQARKGERYDYQSAAH